MIAALHGRLARRDPGEVVVEASGVGYRVRVPLGTYAGLPPDGEPCRLRIVTVVREDEISLYGFETAEEEGLFRRLQGVSGVGPKLALKVLSGMKSDDLRRAIHDGDLRSLTSISGVGKKLAQRLVLELKDKVEPPAAALPGAPEPLPEALEALLALGYPQATARTALDRASGAGAVGLENLVREALRALAPKR